MKLKDNESELQKQPSQITPSFENSASAPKPVAATNCVTPKISSAPTNKQIETRTSDGKRRITPMFIPVAANDM